MNSLEKIQPYFVPVAIIVAGGLIAGAVLFTGGPAQQQAVNTAGAVEDLDELAKNVRPLAASDHVRGDASAPITMIEYSDFQCPYCGTFHPVMQRIMNEYAGRVKWVYRHLPLDSIHPEANPAALASECVADIAGNDAFWTMADSLIANQQALSRTLYEKLAAEVGVPADALNTCLDEARFQGRIDADITNALESGAKGTPFTVVFAPGKDPIPIPGAFPYEAVKSAIEAMLR